MTNIYLPLWFKKFINNLHYFTNFHYGDEFLQKIHFDSRINCYIKLFCNYLGENIYIDYEGIKYKVIYEGIYKVGFEVINE